MDLPAPAPAPEAARDDAGSSFPCGLCDLEQVHKIAQLLLPGLATGCVDNTTGDLFRGPASVAVDVRREMVEYLTRRSESHVAESVLAHEEGGGGGGGSDDPSAEPDASSCDDSPSEIVSDFLDDFAGTKRNLLGRVSGWLLSESREDKIDDFAQEMESNGFWLMDRREAIGETLLKNLDFRNRFHCAMAFEAPEQLASHREECGFRRVRCASEGCSASFCAVHSEKHNSMCPYKILPCEQKCPLRIARREMDRHCITVCPMKLVNCPFYQVGCRAAAFPQCEIERHCSESLQSHLLLVLQVIHKQEASVDELKQRVQLLEKSQSLSELSEALDVRSLTLAIKEQEAKMKKLERDLSKVSQKGA